MRTLVLIPFALLLACQPPAKPEPATATAPPPAAQSTSNRPTVVFLGDSLTAGYGLAEGEAFPALVAAKLAEEGRPIRLVNAGVSGDTSSGGLARLDWLLQQQPAIVVLGLGANDALRGLPLDQLEANLREIVTRSRAAGAEVVLLGMQITPNLGPDYARGYAAIYPRLAAELDLPLVPFLLDGVAADPELNQADGIHPTAEGQRRVAETVFAALEPVVVGLSEDPT
jgi:acyl-CoA thioesterase-1